MIENTVQLIIKFLKSMGTVNEDEAEVCSYGLQLILSTIINIILCTFIGILYNQVFLTTIILIIFFLLRPYIGGYHSKTSTGCVLEFQLVIIISLLIYTTIGDYISLNTYMYISLFINIILICHSPVVHRNNIPNKDVYMHNKVMSKIILTAIFILCILFKKYIIKEISISLILIYFFLLLSKCVNLIEGDKNEKTYLQDI